MVDYRKNVEVNKRKFLKVLKKILICQAQMLFEINAVKDQKSKP